MNVHISLLNHPIIYQAVAYYDFLHQKIYQEYRYRLPISQYVAKYVMLLKLNGINTYSVAAMFIECGGFP
jgi:hypothetical protein